MHARTQYCMSIKHVNRSHDSKLPCGSYLRRLQHCCRPLSSATDPPKWVHVAGVSTHDVVETGSEREEDGDVQDDEDEDMADDGRAEVADVGNVGAVGGSIEALPFTAEQMPSGFFMAG